MVDFKMASLDERGNSSDHDEDDPFVFVFDRRSGNLPEAKIKTGGLFSFDDFRTRVKEVNNAVF
jgi:hypothetical protein